MIMLTLFHKSKRCVISNADKILADGIITSNSSINYYSERIVVVYDTGEIISLPSCMVITLDKELDIKQ